MNRRCPKHITLLFVLLACNEHDDPFAPRSTPSATPPRGIATTSNTQILYSNTDGSDPRALATFRGHAPQGRFIAEFLEGMIEFSPDGEQIVFSLTTQETGAAPGEIWWFVNVFVMNADGSGIRQLTQTTQPNHGYVSATWSPDGKRIAYMFSRLFSGPLARELWVMNADGTAKTRIHDQVCLNESDSRGLDWSPNGRWILFPGTCGDQRPGFAIISPDGLKLATVTCLAPLNCELWASTRNPQWTPTGDLLVVSSGGGIAVMNPATGRLRVINTNGANVYATMSPDGKTIATNPAVFCDRSGCTASELRLVDTDGGNLRVLRSCPGVPGCFHPAWRP